MDISFLESDEFKKFISHIIMFSETTRHKYLRKGPLQNNDAYPIYSLLHPWSRSSFERFGLNKDFFCFLF